MNAARQQQLEATFQAALNRPQESLTLVGGAANGPLAGRKKDAQSFILRTDRIRPDAVQVRRMGKELDNPELKELAESIREHGIQNPVEVRWIGDDDIYELVAGERRYLAATKILGLAEIPVRVIERSESEIRWLQLHENIHRTDLHPLDLAAAIEGVMEEGISLEVVAKKLCKSQSWVQKALTVAKNLSPAAKTAIEGAKIKSLDTVYEVAQVPEKEQASLVNRIVSEGLSRTEIRKVAAEAKEAAKAQRRSKGRPATGKKKNFVKKVVTSVGATVTIQFRRTRATADDVLEALREAMKKVAA